MEVKANGPILKTLLISDLVASTCLVERLGDKRAALLFARHDRLARDLLARHGGFEIDKADGFLLLFERPLAAVRYALDYHQALARLAADFDDLAPEARLRETLSARVGIHLGEIFLRQNPAADVARGAKPVEVEGLAKPIASRLMSLAASRQTLLTRGAFELARRAAVDTTALDGAVCWLSHGAYRIHGVERPIRIYEVGLEGVAPLTPPAGSEKMHPTVEGATLPWRWSAPAATDMPPHHPVLVDPSPPRRPYPEEAGGEDWALAPRATLVQASVAGGHELLSRITASMTAEAARRAAFERVRGRFRLTVAALAATVLVAAAMVFQEHRVRAAAHQAEQEAERARVAEATSRQLSQLLADLVAAKSGERPGIPQGIHLRDARPGGLYPRPGHGGEDDVLILLRPPACSPEVPASGPPTLH